MTITQLSYISTMVSRTSWQAYLFIIPFAIFFAIFLGYPFFYALYLSFHKVTDIYDAFNALKFVHLHNYIKLMKDVEFWWSILMSLLYGAMTIPLSIFVSLILANLLHRTFSLVKLYRTGFFLPYLLDVFVVAIVWKFLYAHPYGIITQLLQRIGIDIPPLLASPKTAMLSVAIAMTLKGCGFGMLLYLAGLQNIPRSLYEAASIDGAPPWKQLFYITLPMLKPITLFMVVTGIIGALSAFAEFYGMTGGGPIIRVGSHILGCTKVAGLYLFRNLESLKLGYAAAISFVLLIIALIISAVSAKLLRVEW